MSAPRKSRAVFAVCLMAVLGLAGCRRQSQPPRADSRAAEKGGPEVRQPARDLKPEQVAALEAALAKNPEDLIVRDQLLIFYSDSGDKVLGQQATIEARRRHILWLIRHHPENRAARSWEALILSTPGDPDSDPIGYREGRKLWLAQVERPDAAVSVLTGAARFFREKDKPLAEKMFLRAKALAPQGRWSTELGRLYYEILVGANAKTPQGIVRSVNLADAHGPYAREIRRKLTLSTDVTLLAEAAESLGVLGRALYENHSIDFDPVALARTYLDRAVQLDPQSILTHQIALSIRFLDRGGQIPSLPRGSSPEAQYQALAALPEAQRYLRMSLLAEAAYTNAEETGANKRDAVAAKAAWETARKCAREALQLAAKFPNDPDHGTAIYNANMVLGLLALRAGNRKAAVQSMLDASKAPATEELAYSMTDFSLKLPEWLFKDGERNSVAEFLERFAQTSVSAKGYLQESAKAIRSGKKPLWVLKQAGRLISEPHRLATNLEEYPKKEVWHLLG